MNNSKETGSSKNTMSPDSAIPHKAYDINASKASRIPILWTSVTPATFDEILDITQSAIAGNKRLVIGHLNLHGIYLAYEDRDLQRFLDSADYVYIDGMPLIWISKLTGYRLRSKLRFTLLDHIETLLCKVSEWGGKVFFLGGEPGIADQAGNILRGRIKNLDLNCHHGFFKTPMDPAENNSILEKINTYNPSLLLVGMGMPKQEAWIIENLDRLSVPVIWPCGATFDYIAGKIASPPRWAGPLGLEGFFRFLSEPRRLSGRYLYEPLVILKRALQRRD